MHIQRCVYTLVVTVASLVRRRALVWGRALVGGVILGPRTLRTSAALGLGCSVRTAGGRGAACAAYKSIGTTTRQESPTLIAGGT